MAEHLQQGRYYT